MRLSQSLPVVLLLAASCGSKAPEAPPAVTHTTPLEQCVAGEPSPEALLPSGMLEGEPNAAIVPIGRKVTPAGTLASTIAWPLAVAFSPDGARAYVSHNGEKALDVIEVATGKVLQTLSLRGYRGLAVRPSDGRVFLAGGESGKLLALAPQPDGTLLLEREQPFPGFLADAALAPDGTLYLVSNSNSKVWALDADTFAVKSELAAGVYPYDLAIAPDSTTVFVSNVAGDDVSVLDFASGTEVARIPTDLNPMGLALDAAGATLYVANSDADSVMLIDTATLQVVDTLDLRLTPADPVGASPNELTLAADGSRLYVSMADLNRVDVLDLASRQRVGSIPTAFYATGVAVSPDGTRLAACGSKGWSSIGQGMDSSPNKFGGVVNIVDLTADQATQDGWTAQATANVERTRQFYPTNCPYPIPVALAEGQARPVQHVVLIIKENKTFDAVFGDFEKGNGDPALTVWGEKFTPNFHALARQFVLADNFYNDSEHSTQGHDWLTQGDANDLFEKTDQSQLMLQGVDPSLIMRESTIFDHCYAHGVTFRDYGEWMGFGKDLVGRYYEFIDHKYPFFNMAIRDTVKAAEVVRELKLGIFPQFIIIGLPNDHTSGTDPNMPKPESLVADNDQGLGMIVEAISQSEYWHSTVIFILEDDPQGYGGDHVHAQRSPLVVVSPWVKRGHLTSVHYSYPSVYRTIEMLLGLPPMNLNTATAAPMYDIFVASEDDADDTPYGGLVPDVPFELNPETAFMAAESARMDWSRPDRAPGLGYILWHYMKGPDVNPPPYAKWSDE
jgi:YVTN family beta-propeller protein